MAGNSYKPPDVGYAETSSATDNFNNVSMMGILDRIVRDFKSGGSEML